MGVHYQRALVLLNQSRPDLAEKELRQDLADEPDSPHAHGLLALCLLERDAYTEATEAAQRAIALSPDSAFSHHVLAKVFLARNRYAEAATAIEEAIRLDASHAPYYGLLSAIRFNQRNWPGALDAANAGLQLDPEDAQCNNLRAMALVKLGRRAEAGATIESTLARDPDDDMTHANQGWALLEKRDYTKAMEHFREALRLNPQSEWARRGIVEALKARHWIYSLMLSYFLWMSRLSRNVQVAILIGGYLGYRQLWAAVDAYPNYAVYFLILIGLYMAFAIMSWLAVPLFNLALRLNKYGRLALSPGQITSSNWVGLGLLLTLGCIVAWAVTGDTIYRRGGIYFGFLLLCLSGVFVAARGWPRRLMAVYTAMLYAIAGYTLWILSRDYSTYTAAEIVPIARRVHSLESIYIWGIFLSQFLANALAMVTVRK